MSINYPSYSFPSPIISFLPPFQNFVSTVTSSITSGLSTVTNTNITGSMTYVATTASLTNLQITQLGSLIQGYQDPISMFRPVTITNCLSLNQSNPQYSFDMVGQANISGGLSIQQSTGSMLALMGSSGTLNFDWSPSPIGVFGTVSSLGFRWQLRDLQNNQFDLNLLNNSNSSSNLYVSGTSGFIGINNSSPQNQLDVVGNLNVSGTQASRCISSNNANIATVTSQQISLPNAASFTGLVTDLSRLPFLSAYTSGSITYNLKLWLGTATTSGGSVTVFPTNTSLASGTPLFSSIVFANAISWGVASSITSIPLFSGKSIATNCSAVSLYGLTGNSVLVGGNSVSYVPNALNVSVLLIGT